MGRNALLAITLAVTGGCDLTCPLATAFEHEPFSVDVAGRDIQDGMSQVLYLPKHIPAVEYDFGAERAAGVVICESDAQGAPRFDASGRPVCPPSFNMGSPPSADADCTIDEINYDFGGVTGATTSSTAHIVEKTEIIGTGLLVTIRCDVSKGSDRGVNLTLTLTGSEKYESTFNMFCHQATSVLYYNDEGVSDPTNPKVVHVGEEVFIRVALDAPDPLLPPGAPALSLDGRGYRTLDADPPVEVVGFESIPNAARRMRVRALRPARLPVLIAGGVQAALPIEVVP